MKISFAQLDLPKSGALALTVASGRTLGPVGRDIDQRSGGALSRAMEAARFNGKAEETLALFAVGDLTVSRLLLVGTGPVAELAAGSAQGIGAAVYAALATSGDTDLTVLLDHVADALVAGEFAAELAFGVRLRSYRFDKYRTKEPVDKKPSLRKISIQTEEPTVAKKAFAKLDKVADGVFLSRDLASEPPNVLYPESFADKAKELSELGVEVDVLDEKKMRKLGMGALLGVGQGSERPPRLVVMRWTGAPDAEDQRPLAFIGKGVTFDTGGISIKPAANMDDMKWDMAGAGAVTGLMAALAGRKAHVNAVGVIGLVENMPDGNAQRPGDVVTSMSGQTIEVLNTDAEGRLVLCDALWYTQEHLKPRFMIDLATLTGAIIVSLGHEHAGLFSNNDELAARLTAAGVKSGEQLWRMPMSPAYDKDIDCDVADMKNIGSAGKAGSIIGAQFLQRFVNGVPWAHLDIAGTAWSKGDKGIVPKGATGFGVRLLNQLVADHYEA
jgi:leucyl aminopeptidase